MKDLQLTELIDVNILQELQDSFSAYTGLAALTTDGNGGFVTEGSGFTEFCTNVVRQSPIGCKLCEECDRMGALHAMETQKPAIYKCHAGLIDFTAPIVLEGRMIGSLMGGQVRTSELDEDYMRERAFELDIEPERYIKTANETYILDYDRVEKAAEFLSELTKVLSELAYQNFLKLQESQQLERAAKAQSEYITNYSITMKGQMEKWLASMENAISSNDSKIMRDTLDNLSETGFAVIGEMEETLDYIKLTSGKLELLESEYDVKYMFRQIVKNVKKSVADKGMQVVLDIDKSVPKKLLGDSGRIGQVVSKLVNMSIEYAANGSINIEVSAKRHTYASILEVKVSTENTNLLPEQIKRINALIKAEEVNPLINGHSVYMGLSSVVLLMKQLSGTIELMQAKEDGLSAVVSFPQLEVKGAQ